jgi:hypoxanthine phosphoribosyltransferase
MENLHPDLKKILIPTQEIQSRVKGIADQISTDFAGVPRLFLIGILKGAFIFLADLTRQLSIPHNVDFMAVSSYGKTSASGAVRIIMDLREPIEGEHVIIVEDILDTGNTLNYLYRILKDRNPASLNTCVLAYKKRAGVIPEVPLNYVGFEIPDVWVVGYGLDYADKHRTLPYIAELRREP